MPSKILVGQGIWGRNLPETDEILGNKTPYFALKSVRIGKKNVYQVTIISTSLYTQYIGQVKRFCWQSYFRSKIGIDTFNARAS